MARPTHFSLRLVLAARRTISFLLLFTFMLSSFAAGANPRAAQSGRRGVPGSVKKSDPPQQPETTPQGESESESKPKTQAKTTGAPIVSFVVFEDDNLALGIDNISREIVTDAFMKRLGQSSAVGLTHGPRGSRKEARDRAKNEKEAYVVLMQLEEESADRGVESVTRADPRTFVIRTFVYAPVTGDLKFTDRVYQRPYRPSTSIGGVRIPVPVGRPERYPAQYQLEQVARDAADRLMSRFHVILPPEN